ncbi:MAG TPA: sorbosone dehydrogenase family protein [Luteimonas sp.]|nr:sorbosone dehydrogenase family protein [Luteimonas sp.]
MQTPRPAVLPAALFVLLAACSSDGPPPDDSTVATTGTPDAGAAAAYAPGTGPTPTLPAPAKQLVPTVQIAPAVGWSSGGKPIAAAGMKVTPFAHGLDHPRTLLALPNGDILVAETNAPPKEAKGLKDMAMAAVMKRAGAGVPSANRISLLRDADGDGVAELRTAFLEGLSSPFGMALVGDTLYVANADAVVKVAYTAGATRIDSAPVKVADLPGGPINHHWTKAMVASADGTRLYVGVGSNSNVAERGMAAEANRATVLEIDPVSGTRRLYASGLRNPTALAWNGGRLWAVVNERDELGDDLVPDYLTSVREGGFYGWPYSYWGTHVDARVQPAAPASVVARAIVPDYGLGSHVAPLGLAFHEAGATSLLPERLRGGAFIGLHGSWNRKPTTGYTVVFVPFSGGKPSGPMQDVLGGFVDANGDAQGRPVGVAFDARGGLLVADDVGNTVWRVTAVADAAAAVPTAATRPAGAASVP